jgi:hypothetical protein
MLIFAAATGTFATWMTTATALAEAPDAQQPTTASAGRLINTSAKIVKVDADKRELTLKDDSDKPFTINVPESISRLDNVKPGDRLQVSFYESVAVSLAKPGTATVGKEETTAVGRTPGALPGGTVAQQTTTTAKITNITPSKDELTIEGPGGKDNTIKVDDPQLRSQLGQLKVGDKIRTTYTQAMATRVTPARSM